MAYRWSGLVFLLCWRSLWVCRTRWSPEKAYLSLLLHFCAVNWSSLCRTHHHVASTPSIDSLLLTSIMALEAYHSEQVESVCWVDSMMIGIRWIGTNQCPCGMGCPVITPNDRAINSMEMMMMFIQVLECLLSQVLTVLFPFHPKSGKRFFCAFEELGSVCFCSLYHGNLFALQYVFSFYCLLPYRGRSSMMFNFRAHLFICCPYHCIMLGWPLYATLILIIHSVILTSWLLRVHPMTSTTAMLLFKNA